MDKQKIDLYLTINAKYFEPSAILIIRKKLEQANDSAFLTVQACELKDSTTYTVKKDDTGMGVLRLLTGGCCGVLTIIDWFTISKKTKQKNLATLSMII